MSNDMPDASPEPRPRDRQVYESAAAARRTAEKRAKILGVEVEGKAWDLMVDAFLAGLEPADPVMPMIPIEGAVLESLDPLVIAGLVVVVPDASGHAVILELSAEGRKRVRRLFTMMAREQGRLAPAGETAATH
ncbi:hypothetical protein [Novosphingobium aquimarinum]|uniref:hypothetical protein n=1 Tax=Novosphingobium aquimarinum TaxID=2682494 RepID=UPI0012EB8D12|nr:hypothetical protein [Novosphingobium aquimarinum]